MVFGCGPISLIDTKTFVEDVLTPLLFCINQRNLVSHIQKTFVEAALRLGLIWKGCDFVVVWLQSNLATILIVLILVLLVGLAILHLVKQKRAGKSSCGCSCSDCPMSGKCH
ncbi:MAG: FeoB-associated Cys-rich membrane protein [Clostridia bacterium]|nr:FeoB-associated Cys-rich membrane protein [Clostridia bacterium]